MFGQRWQTGGETAVRRGGGEAGGGGKRDVHSPFGIVWVERKRRGRKRSGRRAGVSISPNLSRVNGGRCRGRKRRRVKERHDERLTLLKVLR